MQFSSAQGKVAIGLIVIAALGLGYVLWTKSVTPEPTIPPGQSLHNPLGQQGTISIPRKEAPVQRDPSGSIRIPAPGKADPTLGMGPSQGARGRIPGTQ